MGLKSPVPTAVILTFEPELSTLPGTASSGTLYVMSTVTLCEAVVQPEPDGRAALLPASRTIVSSAQLCPVGNLYDLTLELSGTKPSGWYCQASPTTPPGPVIVERRVAWPPGAAVESSHELVTVYPDQLPLPEVEHSACAAAVATTAAGTETSENASAEPESTDTKRRVKEAMGGSDP